MMGTTCPFTTQAWLLSSLWMFLGFYLKICHLKPLKGAFGTLFIREISCRVYSGHSWDIIMKNLEQLHVVVGALCTFLGF